MVKSVAVTAILFLHQSIAFTSVLHSPSRSPFYLASTPETSGEEDDNSTYNASNNKRRTQQPPSENSNNEPITKDMFHRDMLADPDPASATPDSAKVKRKRKNGSTRYRTLDNRDNLPFLVKVTTPDPYTSNDEMERTARKNTRRDREQRKKTDDRTKKIPGGGDNGGKKKTVRKNLMGMSEKDAISSSIYTRHEDGGLQQIIGEFTLDKSTNNGDIIQVGDGDNMKEYQVQTSRCQYKYAGGKRFVMVRKILEVKEMKRVLVEQEIRQIFDMNVDDGTPPLEVGDQPPILE